MFGEMKLRVVSLFKMAHNNPAIAIEKYTELVTGKHNELLDFKKGDWIIRKWKDQDIDIAKVHSVDSTFVYTDRFHRINENGGVEDINEPYPTTMEEDERFEFNWRLMTEEEKEQYKKIIQNIEFQ